MAGVVDRVIYPLSGHTEGTSSVFTPAGEGYDFAIGGLPFRSAASDKWPMRRRSAPMRKDQFDNSANPGEQSFSDWWYRSQSSFHGGAGQRFLDINVSHPDDEIRFWRSNGIDVWTPGQVSLLPRSTLLKSAGGSCLVMGGIGGGTDQAFVSNGVNLTRETGSSAAVTWGGTGTILSMTHNGTSYFVADSTGIYSGPLDNASGGALVWNTGSSNVAIGYPKQRLVAGIGRSVYELTGTGPALPTAIYQHPNTSWRWTAITEGPTAIYAAGYAGSNSTIVKFTLANTGLMPTLTQAVVACPIPEGEIVYSIYGYLGRFMGIGTNKGIRIGIVDGNGDIDLGPLIVETTNPVRGFVGKDRYLFAAQQAEVDGDGGLYRIDLGTEIQDKRFAYAADLTADSGALCSSVTLFGSSGRLVFGIDGSGAHITHATEKVASGYFETSFIRYGTVENKHYKFIRTRGNVTDGSISISTVDKNNNIIPIFTIGQGGTSNVDVTITAPTTPQEHLGIKFQLNRDTGDATAGAILNNYQLKAIPAATKQRLFNIPLLCFEIEKSKTGQRFRSDPLTRVADLEALDASNDLYLFQDLGGNLAYLVYIEDIEFVQVAPPSRSNVEGWGGVIVLTIRTV